MTEPIIIPGAPARAGRHDARAGLAPIPAYPSPSRPRCLVVVESRSVRALVRQILVLEGWEATEEEEGGPASYQAVVADLDCFVWPDEHVSQTVQRAGRLGLPVLALTGQDLNPQQCAAMGSPLLLAKPFELNAFLAVLQSWAAPAASPTS